MAQAKKKPVKKTTTKKTVAKKKSTPKKLNELNDTIVIKPSQIIEEKMECKYCFEEFKKDLTICPFCRKKQKDNTGLIVVLILTIILFIAVIANHFVERYQETRINESEYKFNAQLVSYEELVRSPRDFRNQEIKVVGKVVQVEGTDFGSGNRMLVQIDANLFDGPVVQIIEFEYFDRDYSIGLIEGDIITVYGRYEKINGNIPFIRAQFIVFGT